MTVFSDLAAAVGAFVDAVAGASSSPGDRIEAMLALAETPGTGPFAVCARRHAAAALAEAAGAYQPTSYDDAVARMTLIAGVLDAEITAAGDSGEDDSYLALRTLRAAVVADLTARGADLAPLVRVERIEAVPSLALARELYGDATRADELVTRVDPVHPAFMGGDMLVLGR